MAISGSTAVVGDPGKNSETGAAFLFTRSGGIWSQQAELLPSVAGAALDQFGWSVAIAGNTVVVGDPGENFDTGAAYVFAPDPNGVWAQQAELTAADGATDDTFGFSVAISGSTVVVGAFDRAAYVFTGSEFVFHQVAELTAADGTASDEFGFSVAISESTVVVGAPFKNSQTGAAYVYAQSGSTWTQQAKLTASDSATFDQFGKSVAIAGSTVVVGAPGNHPLPGAAYVFTRSGSTWAQQAELTASDGAAGDEFGFSVAIWGSTVVAGADGANSSAGAAYVFTRSGSTWTQQAKLTVADGGAPDEFGNSVAVWGSTVVVGAFAKDSGTGAAYVFALPSHQAKLTAATGSEFGFSVAVSGSTTAPGSTVVVGAPYAGPAAGAAYVFVLSGGTWHLQATLTAKDGGTRDFFGWSVAISGNTVVVGAPFRPDNLRTGAAYVFTRSGSTWTQQAELTAADHANYDEFGYSVSISGSTVVVGATHILSGIGAAYVFVRSGSTWTQQAKLTAADSGDGEFGWSVAISGSTVVVGTGSTGAAYVFVRSGSTWAQQAKLTPPNGGSGVPVAISGSTVVVGVPGLNSGTGAAYVYVRSGTTWAQQAKLTAADGYLGGSVAISGSTVVVGGGNSGLGTAYVFTRSGSTWTQQAELTSFDDAVSDGFGAAVAISGPTTVVGAPGNDSDNGAAYVFKNA